MRLSELSGETREEDPVITGLASDSRQVKPGYLFAALPGVEIDGARFIPQAEQNGAVAVLASPGVKASVITIEDALPRRRLAMMASKFYRPAPATMVGVTGTNGKTSVVSFAAQLWTLLGVAAGSIGTLGASGPNYQRPLDHTTPEPVVLHETLRDMARAGVTHAAMEVSSHALAQYRADGVRFSIAAFTNITQDHLDYHATFDAYFSAKKRLFTDLLSDDGAAIINVDGAGGADLAAAMRADARRVLTVGANGDFIATNDIQPTASGLLVRFRAANTDVEIDLPLVGAFQAENALLAAAIVAASGFAIEDIAPLLSSLRGAPGRMEKVAEIDGVGGVYVDYAHTPDAVATAISAIRPHTAGRIIIILGAGGDRDREKRPLMGAAAASADCVIVTDDNPRREDPSAIRASVMQGAGAALDVHEIGDRGAAIQAGVDMMREGDVLLIAGKGHETGQTIGTKTIAFSDGEEAVKAVEKRAALGVGRRGGDGAYGGGETT